MEHSPNKAVTFDLESGQVRLGPPEASHGTDNARSVIVPVAALSAVISAAGEGAARDLGRAIGRTLGARVRGRVSEASPDDATVELATELAIVGLGALSFERWGRALVALVDKAPLAGPTGDALLAAAVESAVSSATDRDLHALPLGREGDTLRMLLGKTATIDKVRGWLADGVSWGDAIARLHGGAA